VVVADMVLAVSRLASGEHRALVPAHVQERAELPRRVARHHHRRAADVGCGEIVRLGELRLESEEPPGALEDVFLLSSKSSGSAKRSR